MYGEGSRSYLGRSVWCLENETETHLLHLDFATLFYRNSVAVSNNANTVDTKFAFEAVNNRNRRLYIRFEVKNTKSLFLA